MDEITVSHRRNTAVGLCLLAAVLAIGVVLLPVARLSGIWMAIVGIALCALAAACLGAGVAMLRAVVREAQALRKP